MNLKKTGKSCLLQCWQIVQIGTPLKFSHHIFIMGVQISHFPFTCAFHKHADWSSNSNQWCRF